MDDEDEPVVISMVGTATNGQGDDDEHPVATLWLPDPESRRGWAMRHVWRQSPERDTVGFRRR